MSKRIYTWYIEPLDAHTNETIARELSETCTQRALSDNTGTQRNVWQCSSAFATMLRRNRQQQGLQFRVYVREGNGTMRFVGHLFKSKRKDRRTTSKKPSCAA